MRRFHIWLAPLYAQAFPWSLIWWITGTWRAPLATIESAFYTGLIIATTLWYTCYIAEEVRKHEKKQKKLRRKAAKQAAKRRP